MKLIVCEPSEQLYKNVMAACVANGTTFAKLCEGLGVKAQNARRALYGEWKGPKGMEIKDALIDRSGLNEQ